MFEIYFDADGSIVGWYNVERQIFNLLLNMWIVKTSTQQSFQMIHGVLHIGNLLVFGRNAKDAVLLRKCNVGPKMIYNDVISSIKYK